MEQLTPAQLASSNRKSFDAEALIAWWNASRPRRAAWSSERKTAQALRCRQTQPWVHSTGPRSPQGKARSRLNARSKTNKLDALEFDLVASLALEVDRLLKENTKLKSELGKMQNEPHDNP